MTWLFGFYLYETSLLITVGFLCIIIKPLWTLANARPVLMIVFNKAILSLIDATGTLLDRSSNLVKWDVLETVLFIWRLQYRLLHDILQFGILLNITALAFNRIHCIIWPFYNDWINKKKILIQCFLIWILAMLIAIGIRLQSKVNAYQLFTYIFFVAIGLYLILGAKLAWIKYSSNNLLQSAGVEKDFNKKITIVCLGSFFLWLITFLAQIVQLRNGGDLNLAISMQIIQTIFEPFLFCADEFCLIVLLADFRQIIRKFLLRIFCSWKHGNLNNSQNVIKIMPISKSGMIPISSVAP